MTIPTLIKILQSFQDDSIFGTTVQVMDDRGNPEDISAMDITYNSDGIVQAVVLR